MSSSTESSSAPSTAVAVGIGPVVHGDTVSPTKTLFMKTDLKSAESLAKNFPLKKGCGQAKKAPTHFLAPSENPRAAVMGINLF